MATRFLSPERLQASFQLLGEPTRPASLVSTRRYAWHSTLAACKSRRPGRAGNQRVTERIAYRDEFAKRERERGYRRSSCTSAACSMAALTVGTLGPPAT